MGSYSEEVNGYLNKASNLYAQKKYEEASVQYGNACELYIKEHDEDDIDLLFLYGKCLFQSGVSKSEAFGGASGTATLTPLEEEDNNNNNNDADDDNDDDNDDKESAGNVNFQFNDTVAEEEEEDDQLLESSTTETNKPLNEVNHDDEEEEEEEEEEVEQTDFELLWDILDLSRQLIEEKLSKFDQDSIPKDIPLTKTAESDPYVKLTEKLSETYDLLGEVSLELENFPIAAKDLSQSLTLREKLFESTSQLISESHYKLTLLLEFCVEDPDSRSKAAEHMKLALDIVKSQSEKDEELIKDLEVRLTELNKDPLKELEAEKERIIKGILGERVEDDGGDGKNSVVNKDKPVVNDLTNMVMKKKRKSDNKKIPGQKKQKR